MYSRMNTKGIEGLRGIGAVCIAFFSHYYYYLPERNFPFSCFLTDWFWNYASYFVELFFVISGFVMVQAYCERIKNGQVSFGTYIKKRISRFYPVMIVALLAVIILQSVHKRLTGIFFVEELIFENNVLAFVLNLLCLQGTSLIGSSFNAPSWYLSIVLIMYIVFYIVTYVAGKYNFEKYAYFTMMILGLVLAIKAVPTIFLNCRGVLGFFTGAVLCDVCNTIVNMDNKKQRYAVIGAAFAALLAVCYLGIRYSHNIFSPNPQVVVIYGMIIWPLIVLLVVCVPVISRIMQFKVFTFFGKISFSMYIIHFPVMILYDNLNKGLNLSIDYASRRGFCIYAILVIVISVLCYYFVERKFANLLAGKKNEKKL